MQVEMWNEVYFARTRAAELQNKVSYGKLKETSSKTFSAKCQSIAIPVHGLFSQGVGKAMGCAYQPQPPCHDSLTQQPSIMGAAHRQFRRACISSWLPERTNLHNRGHRRRGSTCLLHSQPMRLTRPPGHRPSDARHLLIGRSRRVVFSAVACHRAASVLAASEWQGTGAGRGAWSRRTRQGGGKGPDPFGHTMHRTWAVWRDWKGSRGHGGIH